MLPAHLADWEAVTCRGAQRFLVAAAQLLGALMRKLAIAQSLLRRQGGPQRRIMAQEPMSTEENIEGWRASVSAITLLMRVTSAAVTSLVVLGRRGQEG